MLTEVKVYSAATAGLFTPFACIWCHTVDPVLNTLLLAGQIGVALSTAFYIWRKAQALAPKKKKGSKKK